MYYNNDQIIQISTALRDIIAAAGKCEKNNKDQEVIIVMPVRE